MQFFKRNPRPFYMLARVREGAGGCGRVRSVCATLLQPLGAPLPPPLSPTLRTQELYPGTYAPTPTHYFMRLLHDKGLLLRVFTQVRLWAVSALQQQQQQCVRRE